MLAEAKAIIGLVEVLAEVGSSLASLAPYLMLAGILLMLAAKLIDSDTLFEAGRQVSITGLIVATFSCLDYARDPTLLGPLWELRRLRGALLGLAYYGYERYEPHLSLKQAFLTWLAVICTVLALLGIPLAILSRAVKLPTPPWLPGYLIVAEAGLSLVRLAALLWLCISLVRLALSARGGLGLLIGWINEYGRRKRYLYRFKYRPTRPKRNPHTLIVGITGGGKSNLLKLLIKREIGRPGNVLVIDFTGEYHYLARHGFTVVDARSKCIDVFACEPHMVADSLRIAFPEAGELSAAIVETRLREAKGMGLVGFAESLIAESEEVAASTTRSALRSIGEKLRRLSEEVEGVGLDPKELLVGRKVLSLKGLTHDESKAFIAELALRVMFSEAPKRPLNLTLVVDEAHRLIPPRRPGVEPIIVRVMREARKYGVKVYAATQSLQDLAETAVGNFDTIWVVGGLAPIDRDFVSRKWGDFIADAANSLTTGYAMDLMDTVASRTTARPFTARIVKVPRFREEPPIAKVLRLLGLGRAPWEAPERPWQARPSGAVGEQPRGEAADKPLAIEIDEDDLKIISQLTLEERRALVTRKRGGKVPRPILRRLEKRGLVRTFNGEDRLTRRGERIANIIEKLRLY